MIQLSNAAKENLQVICDPEKYNTIVFQDICVTDNGKSEKISECLLRSQQLQMKFFDNEVFIALIYKDRNRAEYDKLLKWMDEVEKNKTDAENRFRMFTLTSSYDPVRVYMSGIIDDAMINKHDDQLTISFEIPTGQYGLYRSDPEDRADGVHRSKEFER